MALRILAVLAALGTAWSFDPDDVKDSAQNAVQDAADSTGNAVGQVGGAAQDTTGAAMGATLGAAKDVASKASDSVGQAAKSANDAAGQAVDAAAGSANSAGQALQNGADKAKDTANAAKDAANAAKDKVGQSVGSAGGNVNSALQNAVGAAKDASLNSASSAAQDSFRSAVDSASDAAQKAAQDASATLASKDAAVVADKPGRCMTVVRKASQDYDTCMEGMDETVCTTCALNYDATLRECTDIPAVRSMMEFTLRKQDICEKRKKAQLCVAKAKAEGQKLLECSRAAAGDCKACRDTFEASMADCKRDGLGKQGMDDATKEANVLCTAVVMATTNGEVALNRGTAGLGQQAQNSIDGLTSSVKDAAYSAETTLNDMATDSRDALEQAKANAAKALSCAYKVGNLSSCKAEASADYCSCMQDFDSVAAECPQANTLRDMYEKACSTTTTTTAGAGSSLSSWPWWAWVLLLGLLLCCIGAALAAAMGFFGSSKKAPSKKKRATKTLASPAPAPTASLGIAPAMAPTLAPAGVVHPTYAAPVMMPMYQTAPVSATTRAAPSFNTAVPQAIPTAAPVVTTAAPMAATTAPMVATSVPMTSYQAPAQSLFDHLDTNHDGSISRAEFATLMR